MSINRELMLKEEFFKIEISAKQGILDLGESQKLEEKIQAQIEELLLEENIFHSRESLLKILCQPSFFPKLKWVDPLDIFPTHLQIVAFAKKKVHTIGFLYEMISRWLIPHTFLQIPFFFSCDLKFPEISSENFSLMQAHVLLSSREEFEEILKNRRAVETELKLGLDSEYHSSRILEFKGCSSDRKTTLIQEQIASLIRSRSKDFGQSIFSCMQHFLVTSSKGFKERRDSRHISRIISVLFIMQKLLKKRQQAESSERHLMIKFLKVKLLPEENSALGILVGLNFLKEHEVFEKKHLLRAIRNYIPEAVAVEDSYYVEASESDAIQTLYLEIQKNNGKEFSFDEVALLRERLANYLTHHIEKLVYPVFMPRNEEEVLKNITLLSRQLRFIQDLPQVVLSFEEQSDLELSFTVIVLRLIREEALSIEKLAKAKNSSLSFRFILDRIKNVGVIRRKYIKEATVFRAILPLQPYLRLDHSIDLKHAREVVLRDLEFLVGEVRDFNGGLLAKQSEHYSEVKLGLKHLKQEEELLLEKFYYSLKPTSLALIVAPKVLQELFLMLLNAIRREKSRIIAHKDWLFKQEARSVSIVIPMASEEMKKKIDEALEQLEILSSEMLSFLIGEDKTFFLGYLYFSENQESQKAFLKILQQALNP